MDNPGFHPVKVQRCFQTRRHVERQPKGWGSELCVSIEHVRYGPNRVRYELRGSQGIVICVCVSGFVLDARLPRPTSQGLVATARPRFPRDLSQGGPVTHGLALRTRPESLTSCVEHAHRARVRAREPRVETQGTRCDRTRLPPESPARRPRTNRLTQVEPQRIVGQHPLSTRTALGFK